MDSPVMTEGVLSTVDCLNAFETITFQLGTDSLVMIERGLSIIDSNDCLFKRAPNDYIPTRDQTGGFR
jgi:hypothetical protein